MENDGREILHVSGMQPVNCGLPAVSNMCIAIGSVMSESGMNGDLRLKWLAQCFSVKMSDRHGSDVTCFMISSRAIHQG